MTRTVLLHYHLFKNAGTSLDHVLKAHFGPRWVTAEFPAAHGPQGPDNSGQVAAWIVNNPDAVAFSSHTALGPVPQIPGVRVMSVMMLRDPVARIRSAYRFEAGQTADTWGAQLAHQHDLEGYVAARLARKGDRQCRNFQTNRLAMMVPGSGSGSGSERARAIAALRRLSVVGLVEDFDATLERLSAALRPHFPGFQAEPVQVNVTQASAEIQAETQADRRVNARLAAVNRDDYAVLEAARQLIARLEERREERREERL